MDSLPILGHHDGGSAQQLQSFQVLPRRRQQHLRVAAKVPGRRAQGAPVALHGVQDEAASGNGRTSDGEKPAFV